MTKAEIIKAIEEMTVLELSELVKELEDKFGVSAAPMAMPMMAGAFGGAAAPAAAVVEEKTEFNVVLTDAGAKKIQVIKVVREAIEGLGLKEAKDLVDTLPKTVKENVSKEEAEKLKAIFEEAGAKVEIK